MKIDLKVPNNIKLYLKMSATSMITKAKDFDGSAHTYDEPVVDSRGGKSVRTKYKGQPPVIQIPFMLTWGVNEWRMIILESVSMIWLYSLILIRVILRQHFLMN